MRPHEELLTDWSKAKMQFPGEIVEGMNREVDLITRRAYDYRKSSVLTMAIFHTLRRPPEPGMPHEF